MLKILKTEKKVHKNCEPGATAANSKSAKHAAGEEARKEKLADLVDLVRANLEAFIC